MSDNINSMNFKQLKNEVQSLRDELAIMKRKYEDMIYNLDTDNFSQRVVKQGKDMYTKIEQTAEEISLQAEKIDDNETKMAELSVKAGEISSMTKVNISAHFEKDEAPTKANTNNAQKAMLCLYEDVYYYYNDITEKWEVYPENGLQTLFVQDGDGFRLYGDVKVDGSCVLTESLTFNASDRPVQVEYSVDGTANSWHTTFVSGSDKFMRLKIGSQWSDPMKIVGTDGQNGTNGTNATVSTKDIFNFLTNNGADQGIFPFYRESPYNGSSSQTQVFINAEYIQAGTLSGITVQSTDASGNTVETSDGHIQLYPSGYSYSLVDLGMYLINGTWEPRMRFGRGTDSTGLNGTGWIYKTTNGFGIMYNNGSSIPPTIQFQDDGMYIIGDVTFSGGTVNGLPAGGTGGYAVFG